MYRENRLMSTRTNDLGASSNPATEGARADEEHKVVEASSKKAIEKSADGAKLGENDQAASRQAHLTSDCFALVEFANRELL